jgi:hypothetical protein
MRILSFVAVTLVAGTAWADPCGMVPPIYVGEGGATIKRTGPQKTYVFHHDGVQDIVLRPGYSGNVEEFGMLVALPSPPALRKVPDEIFAHLAAAVDPPEIVIDLRPQPEFDERMMYSEMAGDSAPEPAPPREEEVRVLKQEAVGMYEVAVLEAGSPKALEKWMSEHKFKYPAGMDGVVTDYVKLRWCFVAVKTRIGPKAQTDPQPGMKNKPKTAKPAGASFDGYIQGMGFRFLTPKAVVPMRLATFNEADERRQVVYVLSTDPIKFDGVPESRVVRQLTGTRLRKNVVDPLPLRIIGGKLKDVPKDHLAAIKPQRDPAPHNGRAKELFAGDLLAAKTKELSLEHEEEEKELLNIGERLNLRGPELDAMLEQELSKARERLAKDTISGLDKLHFTLVDGEFPFKYMQENNLTFSRYDMPKSKNNSVTYDAVQMGPGYAKEGIVVEGDADPTKTNSEPGKSWYDTLWGN